MIPNPTDPEQARAVATQAYRLLELWNRIPGTRDDGTIDGEALEAWIKEARTLAKAAGREDIADSRIGNMLSASPMGSDGNWPAEPVREVIDLFRSKPMIEGFRVGKSNRRGVTTRMPRDGGELERQEAAKYRAWAKAIAYDHPHTAKALDPWPTATSGRPGGTTRTPSAWTGKLRPSFTLDWRLGPQGDGDDQHRFGTRAFHEDPCRRSATDQMKDERLGSGSSTSSASPFPPRCSRISILPSDFFLTATRRRNDAR